MELRQLGNLIQGADGLGRRTTQPETTHNDRAGSHCAAKTRELAVTAEMRERATQSNAPRPFPAINLRPDCPC